MSAGGAGRIFAAGTRRGGAGSAPVARNGTARGNRRTRWTIAPGDHRDWRAAHPAPRPVIADGAPASMDESVRYAGSLSHARELTPEFPEIRTSPGIRTRVLRAWTSRLESGIRSLREKRPYGSAAAFLGSGGVRGDGITAREGGRWVRSAFRAPAIAFGSLAQGYSAVRMHTGILRGPRTAARSPPPRRQHPADDRQRPSYGTLRAERRASTDAPFSADRFGGLRLAGTQKTGPVVPDPAFEGWWTILGLNQ